MWCLVSLLDVYLAAHACGVLCRFLMFTWLPMRVVSGAASWCLPGSPYAWCLVPLLDVYLAPHVRGVWCRFLMFTWLLMRVVSGAAS